MHPTPGSLPDDRAPGLSRRTVVAAAWSAPVIFATIASPLAAASGGEGAPATLTWLGSPGVFETDSLLVLEAPAGSPAAGRPGTMTIAAVGYGYVPGASRLQIPNGWSYSTNGDQSIGTFVTPAAGLTLGPKSFTFSWGDFSGNLSYLVTWQSSVQATPVLAPIVVGPRGFPSVTWNTATATFGGSATLTLSVPADSYALGYRALMAVSAAAWPAGTTVQQPAGWRLEEDEEYGLWYLQTETTVAGGFEFVFTFGAGTTPTPFDLQWIAPEAPLATPATAQPPLQLVAAPTP